MIEDVDRRDKPRREPDPDAATITMWVSRASSARAARHLSELERPADPGALILARLQSLRLHQRVGVLVPAAVREVVAEHRSRSLRLVDDAKRHIGLGEAQQCLL